MKTYVDANFFTRLYLDFDSSGAARDILTSTEMQQNWPLPVTTLLRLEVVNGIQRMVYESRTGGQWRVTPEAADAAIARFDDHLQSGVFLRRVPLTLEQIEHEFSDLAGRHTSKHGFRTYDLLHVSSALRLRCQRFLSFDKKAIKLAALEGLRTA